MRKMLKFKKVGNISARKHLHVRAFKTILSAELCLHRIHCFLPREPQHNSKPRSALESLQFNESSPFLIPPPPPPFTTKLTSRWPEEAVALTTRRTQSLVPDWYGESTEATRLLGESQLSRLVEERVNCLNDLPLSRASLEKSLDLHHMREEQWN